MTIELTREKLAWLKEAAASGEVHTVRVSWADRLGTWRGKRLPVETFLESPERRIGFCDGMIVVDVNCDVIQETPFSNFETGYPDMYLRPRLETLGPVGWGPHEAYVLGSLEDHEGTMLGVAPRNVLDSVLARLERAGIEVRAGLTLSGRLMRGPNEAVALLPDGRGREESEPGVLRAAAEGLARSGVALRAIEARRDGRFTFTQAPLPAAQAADQAVVVKAALKEVSRAKGLHAVFMTLLPGELEAAALELELELAGASQLEPDSLDALLGEVRGVLQPSVNAFKAGPIARPAIAADGDGVRLGGLRVSSESDPSTALMAIAAAAGAALSGNAPQPSPGTAPEGLDGAASLLDQCAWARDWLGDPFVENAVPLLRHEAASFGAVVSDWELDRYWSPG